MVAVMCVGSATLAVPAGGQAALVTFGSSLSAPATKAEAHGADSAFWDVSLAGGGASSAPASGQITAIRLKGIALSSGSKPPRTSVHFQDLRPHGQGSVRVVSTTSTFHVPASGDPNQTSTFHPVNFCVHRGDYVDFNDQGGFVPSSYPQGVPYQMFAAVSGSVTDFYTRSGGTLNGAVFAGAPHQGEELLMQMSLATGSNATPLCGGSKHGRKPGKPGHHRKH
jgi:hypothetical protein